jgi:hypothetical protein
VGDRRRPGGRGRLVRGGVLAKGSAAAARAAERGTARAAAGRPPAVGAHDRARRRAAGLDRGRRPARTGFARRAAGGLPPVVHAVPVARRARGPGPGVRQRRRRRGRPRGRPADRTPHARARAGRGRRARRAHGRARARRARPVHVRSRRAPRGRDRPVVRRAHPAAGRARVRAGRSHPRHLGLHGHAPCDDPRHRRVRPGGRARRPVSLARAARHLGGARALAGRPLRAARSPLGRRHSFACRQKPAGRSDEKGGVTLAP